MHGNVGELILTNMVKWAPDNVIAVGPWIYGIKEEMVSIFHFLLTDQSTLILGIMEMITGKIWRATTLTTKTPFTRNVECWAE